MSHASPLPLALRISDLVQEAMLRLYPERFRVEFGEVIRDGYRELARRTYQERGLSGLVLLQLVAFQDTVRTSLGERASAGRAWWRRAAAALAGTDWSWRALAADGRAGARSLARQPGLTLVLFTAIVLGLGAFIAVSGVRAGVRAGAATYQDAGSLLWIQRSDPFVGGGRFSRPELDDLRQSSRSLLALGSYHTMWFVLDQPDGPQRIETGVVDEGFFELLGVQPLAGRGLPADRSAALLGYRFWQEHFAADPGIVGRVLPFTDRERTVVGILPPLPEWDAVQMFVHESSCPFVGAGGKRERSDREFRLIARLRPDARAAQLEAELDHVAWRWRRQYPEAYPLAPRLRTQRLRSEDPRHDAALCPVSAATLLLFGSTLLGAAVLAVARARWAAGSRGRSGLRVALGTGALLGTSSSLAALVLAARLGPPLAGAVLEASRQSTRFLLSPGAVALATGLGVFLGLLLGLLAGWGRLGAKPRRLFSPLLTLQMVLAALLLVTSARALRELGRLESQPPGAGPEQVITAQLDLDFSRHREPAEVEAFRQQLLGELEKRPEIATAAFADSLPAQGSPCGCSTLSLTPGPPSGGSSGPTRLEAPATVSVRRIDPGYFSVVGSRLVAGRNFDDRDREGEPAVAIVSELAARRYFGDARPVGRLVSLDGGASWVEIVGVVAGEAALPEGVAPSLYLSFRQQSFLGVDLLVRASGSAAEAQQAIAEAVQSVDPRQPVVGIETLASSYHRTLAGIRLRALVLTPAALLALLATGWAAWVAAAASGRRVVNADRTAPATPAVAPHLRRTAVGLLLALCATPWTHRALLGPATGGLTSDALSFLVAGLLLAAVSAYGVLAGTARQGPRSRSLGFRG